MRVSAPSKRSKVSSYSFPSPSRADYRAPSVKPALIIFGVFAFFVLMSLIRAVYTTGLKSPLGWYSSLSGISNFSTSESVYKHVQPKKGEKVTLFSPSSLLPTKFKVLSVYPHDPLLFTQGLLWIGNTLYEGTGMYGQGKLIKSKLVNGRFVTEKATSIEAHEFGEGIVAINKNGKGIPSENPAGLSIIQLTWKEKVLNIFDAETLVLQSSKHFYSKKNEGWGITYDGEFLYESDGSSTLHVWDAPSLFDDNVKEVKELDRLEVRDYAKSSLSEGAKRRLPHTKVHKISTGDPVNSLNELEYIHGWIFANIWYDSRIAIIDPKNGNVVSFLDLSSIVRENSAPGEDCLNGIAYTMYTSVDTNSSNVLATDVWEGRLWVTGKYWKRIYELGFDKDGLVEASELIATKQRR